MQKFSTRITPADAGKTLHYRKLQAREEDHPRGCGENKIQHVMYLWHWGSPPRMRGKLYRIYDSQHHHRITPADAGKTGSARNYRAANKDHPRGCGENQVVFEIRNHGPGSPPRMRGKLQNKSFLPPFVRITPADAGKTMRKTNGSNIL